MIINLIIYFTIPIAWILIAFFFRRKDKTKGFYTLFALLIFFLYSHYNDFIRSYYGPSQRNFTLTKLADKTKNELKLYVIENKGQENILAVPDLEPYESIFRLVALTTTAPMYVFNNEEIFLDWTNNLDDDQEFSERWGVSFKNKVTIKEIRK